METKKYIYIYIKRRSICEIIKRAANDRVFFFQPYFRELQYNTIPFLISLGYYNQFWQSGGTGRVGETRCIV